MAGTTPTPDAGRVRRWLSRALVVSGGAAAATAIAWGISAGTASAAENPVDDTQLGDAQASVTSETPAQHDDADAGSDNSDESRAGAFDRLGHAKDAAEHVLRSGAGHVEQPDATGGMPCDAVPAGITGADQADVDGERTADEAAAEQDDCTDSDSASASDADADNADAQDDAPNAEAPADDADADAGNTDGGHADGAASRLKDARDKAQQSVQHHVVDPTRDALEKVDRVLHVIPDFGNPSDFDSPGFDAPWTNLMPGAGELPAPGDASGDDDAQAQTPEKQTASHDADARAPGDGARDHHAVTSTSDNGDHTTSGAERTGDDDTSADGADVANQDSDGPAQPFGQEHDRSAPAPVPSQTTTHAGSHADTPAGAVPATADPFAVAAVGTCACSGLSLLSMSPGSQPGVTPD